MRICLSLGGRVNDILSDRVHDCAEDRFQLQVGDLVMVATDGLFDNLADNHILHELNYLSNKVSLVLSNYFLPEQSILPLAPPSFIINRLEAVVFQVLSLDLVFPLFLAPVFSKLKKQQFKVVHREKSCLAV